MGTEIQSSGRTFKQLSIPTMEDFVFGRAVRPVTSPRGVIIGNGIVITEINFTLPPIDIAKETMPEILRQYGEMIEGVSKRAVELDVPALMVEFEALPEMTIQPAWGLEIASLLAETLAKYRDKHGLKASLRLTPNDTREMQRPPLMRRGKYWDGMVEFFHKAGETGADFISIESTGGKEVNDEALMNADLRAAVFALGILGARDMVFLWDEIVASCRNSGILPGADTACGFANTAMVLADQRLIPSVFAAVIRVAAVPRSLIAFERGAVGPSKDCAYEGPYLKAIAGVPISMEGRSAACAHLSYVGNIAQAVCDCWSNESVQNVRLLSTYAPTISLEQLAYDCRLMNTASQSADGARRLRDWLVESDAATDPQAWVLRPDVVLRISREIIEEKTPYLRTRRAVQAAVRELKRARDAGELRIVPRELSWLEKLEREAASLPESEQEFLKEMMDTPLTEKFLPDQYGLS
jgi:methanol---5-hydroxybenzimidazolylcobamide Co-methyltransferase